MIRDPSDGSVKEPPKPDSVFNSSVTAAPLLNAGTSGLPIGSSKPKDVLRLEASRHWLKEYHASRNPEKVVREMGEGAQNVD